MATSTLITRQTPHYREFRQINSGSQVIPINTEFAQGIPISADGAVFCVAFTPTATTCNVQFDNSDVVAITGGTAREFTSISNPAGDIEGVNLFRASARRKPGTTGAIVAQTVVITVNAVEVGRFNVNAADAGADPVCGYVEIFNTTATGDTRFNLNTYAISFGITAADSDLEIFFEAVGDYLP